MLHKIPRGTVTGISGAGSTVLQTAIDGLTLTALERGVSNVLSVKFLLARDVNRCNKTLELVLADLSDRRSTASIASNRQVRSPPSRPLGEYMPKPNSVYHFAPCHKTQF